MRSQTQKIVLASGNQGKIREFQAMLADYTIIPQGEFQIQEVEETGTTFVENAILKARHAALHSKLPSIADDSGLVVDSIKDALGVFSARYAGENATDEENLLKLIEAIKDIPESQRTARYICVLVFMKSAHDPCPIITQGSWEGRIIVEAKGENGFGYDPIFWVDEYDCTSAQLSRKLKNKLSHRGKALELLTKQLT